MDGTVPKLERQNASLMKRVRIAQAEGHDWKRELRKYVTVYWSLQHATTGKSPAELLFQRNIRGKLPDITTPHSDLEARDKDAEQKGRAKIYTDHKRGAKTSDIEVGDQVLVRQDKTDKFSTTFHSTPHKVVHRDANSVVVQSPTGAKYARNTTFVKRFHSVEAPKVSFEDKCAQELSCAETQEEFKMNCEPDLRGSPTPNTGRPQRQIKLPEKFRDYVIE